MIPPRFYFENTFNDFTDFLLSQEHKVKKYNKGNIILSNAKVEESYYYVCKGTCEAFAVTEKGTKKTICYYSTGSFAHLALNSPAFSIYEIERLLAITDVELLTFNKTTILKMLKDSHAFSIRILEFSDEIIALLSYQSLSLPSLNALTRFSDFLYTWYYYNKPNDATSPCIVPFSQEMISNYIGVTRTQVTRLLKTLKADGSISTFRGYILINRINSILNNCCNGITNMTIK